MVDAVQFRDVVSMLATGVTIITAGAGSETHGMTANAVMSLSVSPMQIAISVAKASKLANLLSTGALFTVSVLQRDQDAVSSYFAGNWHGEHTPQFRFVSWPGGSRIEGCLAAIGCEVGQLFEGGDHWIITGRVLDLWAGSESRHPLLYFDRRYYALGPALATPAPERYDLYEGEPRLYYGLW